VVSAALTCGIIILPLTCTFAVHTGTRGAIRRKYNLKVGNPVLPQLALFAHVPLDLAGPNVRMLPQFSMYRTPAGCLAAPSMQPATANSAALGSVCSFLCFPAGLYSWRSASAARMKRRSTHCYCVSVPCNNAQGVNARSEAHFF
jgi:hypothetical protein